jgi:hypothetical protein
MSKSQLVVQHLARADSSVRASAEQSDFSDEFFMDGYLQIYGLWPNTALEPTAAAPSFYVLFRDGVHFFFVSQRVLAKLIRDRRGPLGHRAPDAGINGLPQLRAIGKSADQNGRTKKKNKNGADTFKNSPVLFTSRARARMTLVFQFMLQFDFAGHFQAAKRQRK